MKEKNGMPKVKDFALRMPKELAWETAVSVKEKSKESFHAAEKDQEISRESPVEYASGKAASAEKMAAVNTGAAINAGRKKLEKELGRNLRKQKQEMKCADKRADKMPELTKESGLQDKIKVKPEHGTKMKEAGRRGRLKEAHHAKGSAFKGGQIKNRQIQMKPGRWMERVTKQRVVQYAKDIKIVGRPARTAETIGKMVLGTLKGGAALARTFLASLWAGGSAVILIFIICMGIIGGALFSQSSSAEPLSAEVLAYTSAIRHYADQYGIGEYVSLIQAIMMQETGGRGLDPMQSSESGYNTCYPRTPGGITDPEYSIECGVQAVKASLVAAGVKSPMDMEHIKLALQNYNFGNGYAEWAKGRYGGYSVANAAEFSNMMAARLGWSSYGDKDYVAHVLRYYPTLSFAGLFGTYPAGGMPIPHYLQTDYKDVLYGGGSISSSGCGPTSFAMVASYLTGRTITPVDAVAWCGNAYYVAGAGTSWAYFPAAASHFGCGAVTQTADANAVLQALADGHPVISSQKRGLFTSGGHFIVLRGLTPGGKVLVNDPNDNDRKNYINREFDMMSEIHVTSRAYWIFETK